MSSPSLSVSSACSDKELLLHLVMVAVSKNGHKYLLNCLLDSGSQRSCMSNEVNKRLGIKIDSFPALQFNIKTFLGEVTRCLKEALINITVDHNSLPIKALFDCNIKLNLSISRLDDLTRN